MLSQIQLQRASKQLQQHLKARLGNSRIVPALAELIADKGIWTTSAQFAIEAPKAVSAPRAGSLGFKTMNPQNLR
jgi:hypothetical protein